MNHLSLFTGAGGGELGALSLGWQTIGYVEIDDYCQKILAQRIKDGILHNAPIFTDIKTFISFGCCELYRGITGVISAGFPCPAFSVAGKRRGETDERNMWPETLECIRRIRPHYIFLENVPGLLTIRGEGKRGYFGRILGDLHEARYDAKWCTLGADDVGAPHRRKRLWVMANTTCK